MSFWMILWTVVFAVCLIGFAVVAVVVAIGGIGDIRALFVNMKSTRNSETEQ